MILPRIRVRDAGVEVAGDVRDLIAIAVDRRELGKAAESDGQRPGLNRWIGRRSGRLCRDLRRFRRDVRGPRVLLTPQMLELPLQPVHLPLQLIESLRFVATGLLGCVGVRDGAQRKGHCDRDSVGG